MKRLVISIGVVVAMLWLALFVHAALDNESPPTVTALRGSVMVYKYGGLAPVAVYRGMEIGDGDVIVTRADSSATVSYSSKEIVIGELTKLSINSIWSRHGREDSSLVLVEGMIKNRVDLELNTNSRNEIRAANTIAGVRGTEYILIYSRMGLEDGEDVNPYARLMVIDGEVRFDLVVPNAEGVDEVRSFMVGIDGVSMITEDIKGGITDGGTEQAPSNFTVALSDLDLSILEEIRNDPRAREQVPNLVEYIDEIIAQKQAEMGERTAEERPEPQLIYASEADSVIPTLPKPEYGDEVGGGGAASGAVASDSVSDSVASESVASDSVASEAVTSEAVSDSVASDSVASEAVSDSVASDSVASEEASEAVSEVVSEPVSEPVSEVVSEPVSEPVAVPEVVEPVVPEIVEPVVPEVVEPVVPEPSEPSNPPPNPPNPPRPSSQAPLTYAGDSAFTYGDAGFSLNVGGGSGAGLLSYSVSPAGIIRVDNDGYVVIEGAGTATVTARKAASAGFLASDELQIVVNVARRSIAGAMVTVDGGDSGKGGGGGFVYDGGEHRPKPMVTLDGLDTSYDISYADNVNAGTATVTIIGTGNYMGEATTTFTIDPMSISTANVTIDGSFVYNATEHTPTPTVTLSDHTPTYTTTYSNNTNAGTATITITGTNNYKGEATTTFTIEPLDLSTAVITIDNNISFIYNGSEHTPTPTVTLADHTLADNTDYTTTYTNNT
ncbi:MAG: hypothetical protein FWG87_14645, partial [Defluviitaleaceae bacterium]|nr:hypothetical protein [Defluviitaleaceae bacterium]